MPDHVERPDLSAALRRKRKAVADVENLQLPSRNDSDRQEILWSLSSIRATSTVSGVGAPSSLQLVRDVLRRAAVEISRDQISRLISASSRSVPSTRFASCARSARAPPGNGTGRARSTTAPTAGRAPAARDRCLSHAPIGVPKPRFLRSRMSRGSSPPTRLLHHVLQPAAADLHLLRHARGELDQLVVEQRHAAFERHRHAHLVGEQQQVVGQLRLGVHGQHAVQRVVAARVAERGGDQVRPRAAPSPRSRPPRPPRSGNTWTYAR